MSQLHLISLTGSPFEMGLQHGALAKERGAIGTIEFYLKFMNRLFQFKAETKFEKRYRTFISRCFEKIVTGSYVRSIPEEDRMMMEGFSQGSGIPYRELVLAYLMPDSYAYAAGRKYGWLNMGCSSFYSGGLHGRNLDYVGGALWNQHPAVIEYQPSTGMRYVSVTSLGVDTAGITSMNEAGLTLSLHLNYSTSVSLGAVPITMIGSKVARTATTTDEALDILKKVKRGSGWSMLISSQKSRDAVKVQFSSRGLSVERFPNGNALLTNHYSDEQLKRNEYWISPLRKEDSFEREMYCREGLAKQPNDISVESAIGILRDCAQVHTVTSVVMDSKNRKVMIAVGESPLPQNAFHSLSLFPGPRAEERVYPEVSLTNARKAQLWYGKAYDDYFPIYQRDRVEEHLKKAEQLDPQNALYPSMLAQIWMEAGKFAEAEAKMSVALTLSQSKARKMQNVLVYGRILDLIGRRGEATNIYQSLESDPKWSALGKRGLHKRWRSKDVKKTFLDFTLGDAIAL